MKQGNLKNEDLLNDFDGSDENENESSNDSQCERGKRDYGPDKGFTLDADMDAMYANVFQSVSEHGSKMVETMRKAIGSGGNVFVAPLVVVAPRASTLMQVFYGTDTVAKDQKKRNSSLLATMTKEEIRMDSFIGSAEDTKFFVTKMRMAESLDEVAYVLRSMVAGKYVAEKTVLREDFLMAVLPFCNRKLEAMPRKLRCHYHTVMGNLGEE